MLFFIVLGLSLVLGCLGHLFYEKTDCDAISFVFILTTLICTMATIIMLIGMIGINVCYEGDLLANQTLREHLIYQYENEFYDNDNDLGLKELLNQIGDFNTDLARGKALNQNLWTGILTSDIYNEIEFIEVVRE